MDGILRDLLFDYTLRTVALGAGALGVVSGALGAFALLRKQSLLGDAISHAALPGIALAFLLTASKAPLVLVLGAALAGWAATLFVTAIVNTTRIKMDGALGLALSVFFGIGLVLLTFIQRIPDANQAGLDKFLFGQAATLLESDVITTAGLGALAVGMMLALWKEFKLVSFDPGFGASLGLPTRQLDVLLVSLLVIAVVVGLQTVGVVLMSAMVVAPAAAARQWTDRLGVMVALAALFGAISGVSGALISGAVAHLPTGPTIVLSVSAIVLLSLIAAPNRGLLVRWLRRRQSRRQLLLEAVLSDMYALSMHHDSLDHAHPLAALEAMRPNHGGLVRALTVLAERGFARRAGRDGWVLTAAGAAEARRLAGQIAVPAAEGEVDQ